MKNFTSSHLKFWLGFIILLVVLSFYLAVSQDRFSVNEDTFSDVSYFNGSVTYNTEFCANRLTELTREAHFLRKEIGLEKKNFNKELVLKSDLEDILEIQQRELVEVKEELESYVLLCDQFDQRVTPELCSQFLGEASQKLKLTQKQVNDSVGLDFVQLTIKDLRDAQRIYVSLREVCDQK